MVVDPRPASAILEAGHEKLVTLLNRPSLAEAFQQAKSFMNPPTFYSCFSACATDNSGSRQGETRVADVGSEAFAPLIGNTKAWGQREE